MYMYMYGPCHDAMNADTKFGWLGYVFLNTFVQLCNVASFSSITLNTTLYAAQLHPCRSGMNAYSTSINTYAIEY